MREKTQSDAKSEIAKPYAIVGPEGTVVSQHDTWIDAYLTDRDNKEYAQDGNYLAEWDGKGYRPCQAW